MSTRTRAATVMAFRDQRRRPLVLILIVLVPAYVILWSVAETKPTPRTIRLAGGEWVATTMKALHGPGMAALMVAFLAALIGVFVTHSALQGDRRLVLAGFRAREAVLARVLVMTAATLLAVAVSAAIMAIVFTPASWLPVIGALVLTGLVYSSIGALVGALLDKLPATYLILFLIMTDLGVVQSPMFHVTPVRFAWLLPGYPLDRVLYAGSFSPTFHAGGELVLALGWMAALMVAVFVVLRRAVQARG
ncbi:MAG: ABC transporter permease [Solirubrobacteraceae bacterium]